MAASDGAYCCGFLTVEVLLGFKHFDRRRRYGFASDFLLLLFPFPAIMKRQGLRFRFLRHTEHLKVGSGKEKI